MFPLPGLRQSYLWSPAGMMGDGLCGGEKLPISEEERARVDSLYGDVSTTLQLKLYVLLTDQPSEPKAVDVYVFLAPFASIVIALDHVKGEAAICSDWWMWEIFRPDFTDLTKQAGSLLQGGRTVDALTFGLDRLCGLLKGTWQITGAYDHGRETATITHRGEDGIRRWTVSRA